MQQKQLTDTQIQLKARDIAESMGLGGLLLNRIMPPLHFMMLINGEHYDVGSDYPQDILEMPVQDGCPLCDNSGIFYQPDGEDDVEGVPCDCIAGEINLFHFGLERGTI